MIVRTLELSMLRKFLIMTLVAQNVKSDYILLQSPFTSSVLSTLLF